MLTVLGGKSSLAVRRGTRKTVPVNRENPNSAPGARAQPTPLAEKFPDADYKFQMRFTQGQPTDWFGPTLAREELIRQRKHWLQSAPEVYAALLPEGEPLLDEVMRLAGAWNGFARNDSTSPFERLRALGEFWEPDWLLLRAGADGEIRLLGGCVCFPSSWKLSEKIGQPIEFIHSVVPGLNSILGPAIHSFLARLKPGIAWQRSNWGLSRSLELNQHPDRGLPRLDAAVRLEEASLRVEDQALVALPQSGGILFGIRIENHALADVKEDTLACGRFRRALETMPEAMAVYKGIATARGRLLELLGE